MCMCAGYARVLCVCVPLFPPGSACGHTAVKELLAIVHPEVGIGVVRVTILTGLLNGCRDTG